MIFWTTLGIVVVIAAYIAVGKRDLGGTIATIVVGGLLWTFFFAVVTPAGVTYPHGEVVGHVDGNVQVVDNPNGGQVYEFSMNGKSRGMDHNSDWVDIYYNNKKELVQYTNHTPWWVAPYTLDPGTHYVLFVPRASVK